MSLQSEGYETLPGDENTLGELVRSFKQQGFQTSETALSVKSTEDARRGTLSAKYGGGAFPFHTDFAFRPLPPRYIILANTSNTAHSRSTLVALIEKLDPNSLVDVQKSSWRLASSRGTFLLSGYNRQNNKSLYRWDSDVLLPANSFAKAAVEYFDPKMMLIAFRMQWKQRSAIIIDNWRCVHAREADTFAQEYDRKLLRIEIWHHAGMDLGHPVQ